MVHDQSSGQDFRGPYLIAVAAWPVIPVMTRNEFKAVYSFSLAARTGRPGKPFDGRLLSLINC